MDQKKVGQFLKTLRKEKSITQEVLMAGSKIAAALI